MFITSRFRVWVERVATGLCDQARGHCGRVCLSLCHFGCACVCVRVSVSLPVWKSLCLSLSRGCVSLSPFFLSLVLSLPSSLSRDGTPRGRCRARRWNARARWSRRDARRWWRAPDRSDRRPARRWPVWGQTRRCETCGCQRVQSSGLGVSNHSSGSRVSVESSVPIIDLAGGEDAAGCRHGTGVIKGGGGGRGERETGRERDGQSRATRIRAASRIWVSGPGDVGR